MISHQNLWLAIIAGGQGTRLFPLSHEGCPKQFCQLDSDNTFIQATAKRFINYGIRPSHIVVVTTTHNQTQLAERQLLPLGVVSPNIFQIEPKYGYAGAMVKATEFIFEINPEAVIIHTPADQYITADENFSQTINLACQSVEEGYPTIVGVKVYDLVTVMGCGHAFYDPEDTGATKTVVGFIEKPNKERAKKLLRDDCSVVNTGINVWSVRQLRDAISVVRAGISTDTLMGKFGDRLRVAIGHFEWYDCGTLKALYGISRKTPNHKNATLGKGVVERGNYCRGSLFVAAEGTKIVAHAVTNAAVVSSEIEGRFVLTIVRLNDSQQVRELAEKYRDNKKILTNNFSIDARNNMVVETGISREVRIAFVGVDSYVVTPLASPDGTIVFSVSNNIPIEKLAL